MRLGAAAYGSLFHNDDDDNGHYGDDEFWPWDSRSDDLEDGPLPGLTVVDPAMLDIRIDAYEGENVCPL